MSRFVAILMRVMVIVDSLVAGALRFGGHEQSATYMMVLAMFSLLMAMDLERGRYDR